MAEKVYSHGRPLDEAFYLALRSKVAGRSLAGRSSEVPQQRGLIVRSTAGILIS